MCTPCMALKAPGITLQYFTITTVQQIVVWETCGPWERTSWLILTAALSIPRYKRMAWRIQGCRQYNTDGQRRSAGGDTVNPISIMIQWIFHRACRGNHEKGGNRKLEASRQPLQHRKIRVPAIVVGRWIATMHPPHPPECTAVRTHWWSLQNGHES